MLKLLFSVFIFALTSLFAADDCGECCPPPRPCPEVDPCVNCAQLWPTCGPDWIVTPNAGPCVRNGADLFFTGEFIYWTARQDHMAFAFLNQNIGTSSPFPVQEVGKAIHPDWTMEPGFKVGLGYMFDHDGWDICLNYTWLRACNTKESVIPVGERDVIDNRWINLFETVGLDDDRFISCETANWELDFNVIDLELGRNFFISRYLYLRPYFGLKGTWNEQKMDVDLEAVTRSAPFQNFIGVSNNKIDNWGIGIRAGLDAAWHFTTCFSFFGEMTVTALWESFEVEMRSFLQNTTMNVYENGEFLNNDFHTIKPVLELLIGLRLENWFCCDEYHWSIEAGWEEQWWSNQNQFLANGLESRHGDLILHGLTLKLRFDF